MIFVKLLKWYRKKNYSKKNWYDDDIDDYDDDDSSDSRGPPGESWLAQENKDIVKLWDYFQVIK